MNLFPYARQTIHTSLSREQVYERLSSRVLSRQPLCNFYRPLEYFCGSVHWDSFQIYHSIKDRRNSFSPQIRGTITSREGGTELHLSMALHPIVAVFLKFFLFVILFFLILGAVGCFIKQEMPLEFFLYPLGIGTFSIALTHIAFREGCKDAIRYLKQILR